MLKSSRGCHVRAVQSKSPSKKRTPEPTGMLVFAEPTDDLGAYECAFPESFYQITEARNSHSFSMALDINFALRAAADKLCPEEFRALAERLNGIAESYGMKHPTRNNSSCDFFSSQESSDYYCKSGLLKSLTANPQDLSKQFSHRDNLKLTTPFHNLTEDSHLSVPHYLAYATAGQIYTEAQASALKEMFRTWVDMERGHLVAKSPR